MVVAELGEDRAVEVAPALLAYERQRDRPLGVLGPEVRLQHLHFLHELRVRVHRGRAVAAGIIPRGAVDGQVDAQARPVGREVPVRALVVVPAPLVLAVAVDAVDLPGERGAVGVVAPREGRHSRENPQDLGRARADHGHRLDLLPGQRRRLLARVERRQGHLRAHRDGLGHCRQLQRDRAHGPAVAPLQHDVGDLVRPEAGHGHGQRVRAGGDGGEGEEAVAVRHRPAGGPDAALARATSAPGITPPWVSATVPLSSPVMRWAWTAGASNSRTTETSTDKRTGDLTRHDGGHVHLRSDRSVQDAWVIEGGGDAGAARGRGTPPAGPDEAGDLVRSRVHTGSQWHGRSAVGSEAAAGTIDPVDAFRTQGVRRVSAECADAETERLESAEARVCLERHDRSARSSASSRTGADLGCPAAGLSMKYEILGMLRGPNGRAAGVRSIWIVLHGETRHRLVTLVPWEEA